MSNPFSSQFEYQPPGEVYLDSPANGVISNTTFEIGRQSDELCRQDVPGYRQRFMLTEMKELRGSLADMLSVEPSNLAFLPSFSVAHNYLMTGLNRKWKVWSLEGDYPSLIMPFELYGFELTKTTIPSKELSPERILESIDKNKPDLVVMSHVQWLSGFKVDLEKLGAFCRDRGVFTLIDGTQFIGTAPLNLKALQVDAYGASGYKWLLAGFGNGFLFTAPGFFEELDIRIGGFGSLLNFQNEWKYEESMKNFEPGHLDHISFTRMKNAVNEWSANDPVNIDGYIRDLLNYLLNELNQNGVDVYDYRRANGLSSILSVGLSDEQTNALKQQNIRFSKRGGRVRIGCHIYNTVADVDRFVSAVTS